MTLKVINRTESQSIIVWQCNFELIQHWHKKFLFPVHVLSVLTHLSFREFGTKLQNHGIVLRVSCMKDIVTLKKSGFRSLVPSPNSCSSKTIYAQNQPKWKLRKKPLFSCRSSFTSLMIGKVDLNKVTLSPVQHEHLYNKQS